MSTMAAPIEESYFVEVWMRHMEMCYCTVRKQTIIR